MNSNPTILWNRQNFSNEETAANVKDVAPNEFEETKDHGIYLSFKVFIVYSDVLLNFLKFDLY